MPVWVTRTFVQATSEEQLEQIMLSLRQGAEAGGFFESVMFEEPVSHSNAGDADEVVVYTDGGCDYARGGVGAWAFIARVPGELPLRKVGTAVNTTNNQMEMQAVIEALSVLEIGRKVVIYADSEYVIKGITQWSRNWVRNGWKTKDGGPVKNVELWQPLLDLYRLHTVRFVHVKGHTGVADNEWCDSACSAAIADMHKQILEANS